MRKEATFFMVSQALRDEMTYQVAKLDPITSIEENNPQVLVEWVEILHQIMTEIEESYANIKDNRPCLNKILQLIATGVACLEQQGIVTRQNLNQDDIL